MQLPLKPLSSSAEHFSIFWLDSVFVMCDTIPAAGMGTSHFHFEGPQMICRCDLDEKIWASRKDWRACCEPNDRERNSMATSRRNRNRVH